MNKKATTSSALFTSFIGLTIVTATVMVSGCGGGDVGVHYNPPSDNPNATEPDFDDPAPTAPTRGPAGGGTPVAVAPPATAQPAGPLVEGGLFNGLYPQPNPGFSQIGFAGGLAPNSSVPKPETPPEPRPSAQVQENQSFAGSDNGSVERTGPATLIDRANLAFGQGDEKLAFQYLYAYLLTDDTAIDNYPLGWYSGIAQPRAAFRWGIGIQYRTSSSFEGNPPVIGDPVNVNIVVSAGAGGSGGDPGRGVGGGGGGLVDSPAPGGGRGASDEPPTDSPYKNLITSSPEGMLLYYTGEFGDKTLQRLDMRRTHADAYYGKILQNVFAAVPADAVAQSGATGGGGRGPAGGSRGPAGSAPAGAAGGLITDDPAPQSGVSFSTSIAPIIVSKCGQCHVQDSKGDVDLSTFNFISTYVAPRNSGASKLLQVIESGEMPKGGLVVTRAEQSTLTQWINDGASFDGSDANAALASRGGAGLGLDGRPRLQRLTGNTPATKPSDATIGTLIPGVMMLGAGDEKDLIQRARELGLDGMLLFNVRVTSSTKTPVTSTTLKLINLYPRDGKEDVATVNLKHDDVAKKRERGSNTDPIEMALDEIFQDAADLGFKSGPLPELKPEHVKMRVDSLLQETPANPLPAAVEVMSFFRLSLLDEEYSMMALDKLLGAGMGAKLLSIDSEERAGALENFIPKDSGGDDSSFR